MNTSNLNHPEDSIGNKTLASNLRKCEVYILQELPSVAAKCKADQGQQLRFHAHVSEISKCDIWCKVCQ